MPSIEITLDDQHLKRALEQAVHLIRGKELATSISLGLLERNKQRHEKHLAPDETQWEPLKKVTIARKKNPRWLVEEGDMLRFYSRVSTTSVQIGTVDRKAFWHHAGTSRGLPARKLVGFEETDRKYTIDLLNDHIQAILRRSNLT